MSIVSDKGLPNEYSLHSQQLFQHGYHKNFESYEYRKEKKT
uniref:Uncharacterized protein n=1 Tax=Setaria italica TaxID=4555 RepID=K4ANH5_SETIT